METGRPPGTPLYEDAHFSCAPWKRVRIFEEISGVFQDAHFRKVVRTFEPRAHLRQGVALDPVPLMRKVAQPLAAALGRACPAPGAVDALRRAATCFGFVRFVWTRFVSFMRSLPLERPLK
jgi:hypothetical protein